MNSERLSLIVSEKRFERLLEITLQAVTSVDILGSIVVSIPACHAGDQGSIPCRGEWIFFAIIMGIASEASRNFILIPNLLVFRPPSFGFATRSI